MGLKAPFVRVGASLPDGTRIRAAKLRGVDSHGMLMSAAELGLGDDADGLLALPADSPPGVSANALLALDDVVYDLELTPNRGDCLGVIGIAREVGVLNDLPLTEPDITPVPATTDATFEVRLSAPEGCSRYLGRVISGIDPNRETPLWMRERLRRCGLRSIDPVVDVTNYVLLELGQPMHAFDLARLSGYIDVRMAAPGERLTLLDGRDVALQDDTLLITDADGPVAMAGVMGGERSGVQIGSQPTRDVFLECAWFAPLAIAGRQRAYGLQTDAAHRYERGVDVGIQHKAMERATQLLVEIVGGAAGPVIVAEDPEHLPMAPRIELRASRIEQLLGFAVDAAVVDTILARLGLLDIERDTGPQGTLWRVTAPSHRFDLEREVDLIEEVARIHGYEAVPMASPMSALSLAPSPERERPLDALREQLVDLGYHEAITYSFIDPELARLVDPETPPRVLHNPMASDQSAMRTSLWPGLLTAAAQNLNRQQARVRLFEIGRCFLPADGAPGEDPAASQPLRVGGVLTGQAAPESWNQQPPRGVDFFDVKGDVEALFDAGVTLTFGRGRHPALHAGQAAEVTMDGRPVGFLGRVHPALEARLALVGPVFVFELDARAVTTRTVARFGSVSRFPAVRRDIAVLLDRETPAAALLECVRGAAGQWLTDLRLFDVYSGKGIDSNKKSVGLGLTFQHPSRTLKDAEVSSAVDSVVAKVAATLGGVLR